MKLCPSDKYNVAWFKLAEFVARGEKERALGMFKLLMHSVNNQALAFQLQGDLLLSFEDAEALECYHQAATLYVNDSKFIQATAIYEHLLSLCPESDKYLEKLVELYQVLNNEPRVAFYFKKLVRMLINNNELDRAELVVTQCTPFSDNSTVANIRQMLCIAHIKQEKYTQALKEASVENTLNLLVDLPSSHLLGTFLTQLETSHKEFYTIALAYLEKQK